MFDPIIAEERLFGFGESELIIATITMIALISVVILMFKIDRKKPFRNTSAKERERDESDSRSAYS